MTRLTAAQLRVKIIKCAAWAKAAHPNDINLRVRVFAARLCGSVEGSEPDLEAALCDLLDMPTFKPMQER